MSLSSDSAKLYDVLITFHSAHFLPVADVPSLSADPYILASLHVPSYANHEEPGPPTLLFRTRTLRRTRDPDWGAEVWRVGGVPGAGFALRVGVRDEDAGKKDDRLGEARKDADADWGQVREGLKIERKEASIKKRRGGVRAYISTYATAAVSKKVSRKGGNVVFSVEVLGLSENQKDRRVYTLGPNYFSLHFSPLLGRMMGTKSTNTSNTTKKPAVSNFQANKLQLTGPVPKDLNHKYVGYRPFIEIMFSKSGIQGRLLNHALKKQHKYVYSHDQATVYGVVERHQGASNVDPADHNKSKSQSKESSGDQQQSTSQSDGPSSQSQSQPRSSSHEPEPRNDVNPLAAQFLHMTQHGAGHRLYTYVVTLDAQWRFTETGDEFAIEMLSKHSVHADAARYIAYSGEFFVRRLGTKGWEEDEEEEEEEDAEVDQDQETHDDKGKESQSNGGLKQDKTQELKKRPARYPPSAYELVIDNDSGTYRPHKELLPLLAEFLGSDANLGGPGGIGKITAMDGFDESLKDTKKRRAEAKNSKSSDGKNEKDGKEKKRPQVQLRRGTSLSSAEAEEAGLGRRSMSSASVDAIVTGRENGEGKGGVGGKVDEGKEKLGEMKEGVAELVGKEK
ncbi:hypothetical protein BDV93DRAFT_499691 [Ceratobasidium sp. AG-I]|nr:hypothetical protein BDV93DRAFT_499691 [Ceratobasidium sp. AG-I]